MSKIEVKETDRDVEETTEIFEYIRDEKNNKKGIIYGVFFPVKNEAYIIHSMCNLNRDKFDKTKGLDIINDRLKYMCRVDNEKEQMRSKKEHILGFKNSKIHKLIDKSYANFDRRCRRYFKNVSQINWYVDYFHYEF